MSALRTHPAVLWGSRILLAVVFLWAAQSKITDIPAFAANIKNYAMMPVGWLPAFATLLAGLEVAVGLSLLTGLWRKGSALVVTGMLTAFIIALVYAYASGRSIHCGCFTSDLSAAKAEDLRTEMISRIVQDAGLLVVAVNLFWAEMAGGSYARGES